MGHNIVRCTIVRDMRGPVWAVMQPDGLTWAGLLVHQRHGEGWIVLDAGPGVLLPRERREVHASADAAADQLLDLRANSLMLRADDSGLLGYERLALAIAERDYPATGELHQAVHDELGISEVRYRRLLVHLSERPEAHAYAPAAMAKVRQRIESMPYRRYAAHALAAAKAA